ncbi:uncharacterized protein TrAtP1_008840 [Trichoderma atroviride]|uniref:uncharacterized protein n=1 Tax=Hypocrea atroviridis TaxID=63577 RepID=UPI00331FDB58|nr:hypothetical protein TrAtP1_008840 [Trichoderma atroviride]
MQAANNSVSRTAGAGRVTAVTARQGSCIWTAQRHLDMVMETQRLSYATMRQTGIKYQVPLAIQHQNALRRWSSISGQL